MDRSDRIKAIFAYPTDVEIGKAARQFRDDQGDVTPEFAFQAGARWACKMVEQRHANYQSQTPPI